jgi:Fuc2NAc and GlcNAc transferase
MFYLILGILSFWGTYLIRRISLKYAILDIPNSRSSHDIAVPRGGGIAIIVTFYIGLFLLKEVVDIHLFYALFAALPIALIGMLDDIYTLSSKIRLLVQSFSALLALYFLGGVDDIDLIFFHLHGIWLNVIAFFAIVWLTNLYNFLDGIDGYAGMEAVSVGLGMFLLFHQSLGLVLVVASLGFLMLNWHKASIFMGDVGSATLGFIFAVFLFYDTSEGKIYIWMVLLSLFWVDATVTLILRYIHGEKLSQAHKKHAYQRLTQSGWSHSRVTLMAFVINLLCIGVLYMWKTPWIVFLFNMLLMYGIWRWIEKKKGFI